MPAQLKDIIKELQFLSDRISTQVRSIAIAMIGLVWVLLVGGDKTIKLGAFWRTQVLVSGILALGAMFLDFLQYFFGYLLTNDLRQQLEASGKEEGEFNPREWRYRLRIFAFWAKQVVLLIALGWLGFVLGVNLIF